MHRRLWTAVAGAFQVIGIDIAPARSHRPWSTRPGKPATSVCLRPPDDRLSPAEAAPPEPTPYAVLASNALIHKDRYVTARFSLPVATAVQVRTILQQRPSVDVYLLNERMANKWATLGLREKGTDNRFSHFANLGIEGLASQFISAWGMLPSGNHTLVVDNIDFGTLHSPENLQEDIAVVAWQVSAR